MNSETKRLAIIATICFFPAGIAGWLLYKNSSQLSLKFFRSGIYMFILCLCFIGAYAVIMGGRVVEALGTFF